MYHGERFNSISHLVGAALALAALVALVQGQLGLLVGDALGYGLMLGGALLVRRGRADGAAALGAGAWWRRWPPETVGAGIIALGSGVTAWLGAGHHPAGPH